MNIEYIFLAVLIFLMYGMTLWVSGQEGFENEGSVTHEDFEEIYDDVYAGIYDLLWGSLDAQKYVEVSLQDLCLADWNTKNVRVLDMACGTAPHATWFKELGVDYKGVDISDSMLKKARDVTPSATFQKGDIYINDMPITEIDINDLREKIVYIPQSPRLFNRTLWENISYGLDKSVTREYVLNFIKECGLDEIEIIFRNDSYLNVRNYERVSQMRLKVVIDHMLCMKQREIRKDVLEYIGMENVSVNI
jgi:SAM-dependent methyltransferase